MLTVCKLAFGITTASSPFSNIGKQEYQSVEFPMHFSIPNHFFAIVGSGGSST